MASSVRDLHMNHCKLLCGIIMNCSHECDKKCHWPDFTHQPKCAVNVKSTCPKHPFDIPCHRIFASIPRFQKSKSTTLNDALKMYKCDIKVDLYLPCSHIQKIPCSDEDGYIELMNPLPKCTEKAATPFVYEQCKHIVDGNCSTISSYINNSKLAPPCSAILSIFLAM